MICKRCGGSGTLLRRSAGVPISKSFRKCTSCNKGVRGVRRPGLAPAVIAIHALKKRKPPKK